MGSGGQLAAEVCGSGALGGWRTDRLRAARCERARERQRGRGRGLYLREWTGKPDLLVGWLLVEDVCSVAAEVEGENSRLATGRALGNVSRPSQLYRHPRLHTSLPSTQSQTQPPRLPPRPTPRGAQSSVPWRDRPRHGRSDHQAACQSRESQLNPEPWRARIWGSRDDVLGALDFCQAGAGDGGGGV